MLIEINTDNHLNVDKQWIQDTKAELEHTLERFAPYLTRVEVFFNNENKHQSDPKKIKCAIEARMKNHQPITVTEFSENMQLAMNGANQKIKRCLNDTIKKLSNNV